MSQPDRSTRIREMARHTFADLYAELADANAYRDVAKSKGVLRILEEYGEAVATAIEGEVREQCARQIPKSWLDPLLTGPGAVIGKPPSYQDIERLLSAIAAAIRKPEKGQP